MTEAKKRKAEEGEEFKTSDKFMRMLVTRKAESLIPSDGRIFVAQRTDKLVDVWKGLIRHNFLSVPVLQKTGQKYYGFVDLADIVLYMVNLFGASKLNIEKDFWELYSKEEILQDRVVNDIMSYPLSRRNPFHPVPKGYSILAAVELLAREKGLHRVPVVDQNRKLINMLTQSMLVKFLFENLDAIGNVKNKPVSEMMAVSHEVITVHEDEIAIDAFSLMSTQNVSGVGVVDKDGKLVGNISLRDLKAISSDGRLFWRLHQTVKNFLMKIKNEYQEKDQRPTHVITTTETQTLEMVIRKIHDNKIHRIFVVDAHHKPTGVISLKDVLLEIISSF